MHKPVDVVCKNWSAAPVGACRSKDAPILLALILGCAVMSVAGCSKPPQAHTPPSSDLNTPANSNAAPGQAGAVLVQPNGQPDMAELQRCVIRWIVAHHKRPANFTEFAGSAGVTIPPPPPGKKYSLSPDMHVKLVDQ